jgi:uncharacterized protein YndB with AHSA1/START domain
MQRVHVVQDFPQPVEQVFEYLSESENLGPLYGAKIRRLGDGTDGHRNGVGHQRELKVGPMPVVETIVEFAPNELIRYQITKGGVLKNHEGLMRFSRQGDGTHLEYTVDFDGVAPGVAPIAKQVLKRSISKGLAQYAERGR